MEYIKKVNKEAKVPKQNTGFQAIDDFLNDIIFHLYNLKMSSDKREENNMAHKPPLIAVQMKINM